MRDAADWNTKPITADTYAELIARLEERYPGKVRRTVEVCPVAVINTIDNEDDALETIVRLKRRSAKKGGS